MNRRMMWEEAEAGRGPYPDEDHDDARDACDDDGEPSRRELRALADRFWTHRRHSVRGLALAASARLSGDRGRVAGYLLWAACERRSAERLERGVPR